MENTSESTEAVKSLVLDHVRRSEEGVAIPDLVRSLAPNGVPEKLARDVVEQLIETGPLHLDVAMKLRMDE
jgi:hypothetical protein